MLERLTNNMWWKILSLFIGFALWVMIINISDPEITRTKSVTLEILNEDVLQNAGKTYRIIGGNTVNVQYTVRTSDAHIISSGDFRAYIDLANLYDITGSVPVSVEVLNHSDLFLSEPKSIPSVLRIETEDIQRKSFELTSRTRGEAATGMAVGEISLEPSSLYVSGPVSKIGLISSVGVEIDITNVSSDLSGQAEIYFYDANGNIMDLDRSDIDMDYESITYYVSLLRGKTLGFAFNVGGVPAPGYRYTGAESSTKSISVIGEPADLSGIENIEIPSGILNIDGATQDKTIVFDITEYLPANVKASGNTQISVTLKVEALHKKSYQIDIDDMSLIGKDEDFTYKLSPEKITLIISGLEEDLNNLSSSELDIELNVKGLTTGVHEESLKVNLGNGFVLDSYTPFSVLISEQGAEIATGSDAN